MMFCAKSSGVETILKIDELVARSKQAGKGIDDFSFVCVFVCFVRVKHEVRELLPGRCTALCKARTVCPAYTSATDTASDHPARHSAHTLLADGRPWGPPANENAT